MFQTSVADVHSTVTHNSMAQPMPGQPQPLPVDYSAMNAPLLEQSHHQMAPEESVQHSVDLLGAHQRQHVATNVYPHQPQMQQEMMGSSLPNTQLQQESSLLRMAPQQAGYPMQGEGAAYSPYSPKRRKKKQIKKRPNREMITDEDVLEHIRERAEYEHVSVQSVRDRLRIGYKRAKRLVDQVYERDAVDYSRPHAAYPQQPPAAAYQRFPQNNPYARPVYPQQTHQYPRTALMARKPRQPKKKMRPIPPPPPPKPKPKPKNLKGKTVSHDSIIACFKYELAGFLEEKRSSPATIDTVTFRFNYLGVPDLSERIYKICGELGDLKDADGVVKQQVDHHPAGGPEIQQQHQQTQNQMAQRQHDLQQTQEQLQMEAQQIQSQLAQIQAQQQLQPDHINEQHGQIIYSLQQRSEQIMQQQLNVQTQQQQLLQQQQQELSQMIPPPPQSTPNQMDMDPFSGGIPPAPTNSMQYQTGVPPPPPKPLSILELPYSENGRTKMKMPPGPNDDISDSLYETILPSRDQIMRWWETIGTPFVESNKTDMDEFQFCRILGFQIVDLTKLHGMEMTVHVVGSRPRIWRKILIPSTANLGHLAVWVKYAFGWDMDDPGKYSFNVTTMQFEPPSKILRAVAIYDETERDYYLRAWSIRDRPQPVPPEPEELYPDPSESLMFFDSKPIARNQLSNSYNMYSSLDTMSHHHQIDHANTMNSMSMHPVASSSSMPHQQTLQHHSTDSIDFLSHPNASNVMPDVHQGQHLPQTQIKNEMGDVSAPQMQHLQQVNPVNSGAGIVQMDTHMHVHQQQPVGQTAPHNQMHTQLAPETTGIPSASVPDLTTNVPGSMQVSMQSQPQIQHQVLPQDQAVSSTPSAPGQSVPSTSSAPSASSAPSVPSAPTGPSAPSTSSGPSANSASSAPSASSGVSSSPALSIPSTPSASSLSSTHAPNSVQDSTSSTMDTTEDDVPVNSGPNESNVSASSGTTSMDTSIDSDPSQQTPQDFAPSPNDAQGTFQSTSPQYTTPQAGSQPVGQDYNDLQASGSASSLAAPATLQGQSLQPVAGLPNTQVVQTSQAMQPQSVAMHQSQMVGVAPQGVPQDAHPGMQQNLQVQVPVEMHNSQPQQQPQLQQNNLNLLPVDPNNPQVTLPSVSLPLQAPLPIPGVETVPLPRQGHEAPSVMWYKAFSAKVTHIFQPKVDDWRDYTTTQVIMDWRKLQYQHKIDVENIKRVVWPDKLKHPRVIAGAYRVPPPELRDYSIAAYNLLFDPTTYGGERFKRVEEIDLNPNSYERRQYIEDLKIVNRLKEIGFNPREFDIEAANERLSDATRGR